MQLQFLQELENLSLDGEAFLAQFLEFLLDRSLSGDARFESLIPTVAQVLDLKLPITTVTSSFALLQAHWRQNNQKNISSNYISQPNSPTKDTKNTKPPTTKTEETKILPVFTSESKIVEVKASQEFNSVSDTDQAESVEKAVPVTTSETAPVAIEQPQNSAPKVSLSQVHAVLVRRIAASSQTQLKLLMSDLSIANIDLHSNTGILTLSSGALLNFLKTKQSLTWLAKTLEEEFGWKLELSAQQRESKTVLFESDELLVVSKNNYSSQNLPKTTTNSPTNLNQSLTPQTTAKEKESASTTPENKTDEETKTNSVEYRLFWPQGIPAPHNLGGLPIIKEIPEPPKLDWEDLVADFEME